jgi:putative heme-binding domain-containing protein
MRGRWVPRLSLSRLGPARVFPPGAGIPARGAALFFDPTQMSSCRACHSYRNKGGPVGPDLIDSDKTAEQIYRSISRPKVTAAAYPSVALDMRSGGHVLGVKVGETSDEIVVFDVSSLPPVKRTLLKSDIAQVEAIINTGIYDHTALPFSKQDRLDLGAYLGKSESSPPAK